MAPAAACLFTSLNRISICRKEIVVKKGRKKKSFPAGNKLLLGKRIKIRTFSQNQWTLHFLLSAPLLEFNSFVRRRKEGENDFFCKRFSKQRETNASFFFTWCKRKNPGLRETAKKDRWDCLRRARLTERTNPIFIDKPIWRRKEGNPLPFLLRNTKGQLCCKRTLS